MIFDLPRNISILDISLLTSKERILLYKEYLREKEAILTLKQWENRTFGASNRPFRARAVYTGQEYLRLCKLFKVKERRGRRLAIWSVRTKSKLYGRYGFRNSIRVNIVGEAPDNFKAVFIDRIIEKSRKTFRNAHYRKSKSATKPPVPDL